VSLYSWFTGFSAYEFTDEQPEEGKAAQPPATAVTTPEDELDENSVGSIADELLSPLDKSLELQLDQAESKLLEDSELDQVLNILSGAYFQLKHTSASPSLGHVLFMVFRLSP